MRRLFLLVALLPLWGHAQTAIGYLTHRRIAAVHVWAKNETDARAILDRSIDDPNIQPYADGWFATQAPTKGPSAKDPTKEEFDAVEKSPATVDLSRLPGLYRSPDTTLGSPAPDGPGQKIQYHFFVVKDASYAVRVEVGSVPKAAVATRAYSAVQNLFVAPLYRAGRLDYVRFNLSRGVEVQPTPDEGLRKGLEDAVGAIPWGRLVPINPGEWVIYVTTAVPSYPAPFDVTIQE